MSKNSSKQNEFEVDRMEYYKQMISKLAEKERSLSSRVLKEDLGSVAQANGKERQGNEKSFPLFTEGVSGLSEYKKEKLKHVLHEVVSFFANDIDKVARGIRTTEGNAETRQEAAKFCAGLLEKLDEMAQGVDDILDIVASKCRPMTTAEKLELSMRIRKLPEKAFDRVVEIIKMRIPVNESSDRISFNLGVLDDATLWRLYYCVENTREANKT